MADVESSHFPGGSQKTAAKLVILDECLDIYTTIMDANWKKERWYVDTHAGTGRTIVTDSGQLIDGSAILAIEKYSESFERFYFYELKPDNFQLLHETLAERFGIEFEVRPTLVDGEDFMVARHYGDPKIVIMQLDSNDGVSFLAEKADPHKHWFVFMDPKGLTAKKETLDTLIDRGNCDILITYQTSGVMRSAAEGAEHAHDAVTRTLGDDGWETGGDDDDYVRQFKEKLEENDEIDRVVTKELVSRSDKRHRFDLVFACQNARVTGIVEEIMTQDGLWEKAAEKMGDTTLDRFSDSD